MEAGTLTLDTSTLVEVARRMATVPAERLDLTVLLCFEKKLTEVPGAAASLVGESAANFFTLTILVPPFLAPPTFFSTKMGVLAAFLATTAFFANL